MDESQAIPTVLAASDAHVDQPSSSLIPVNSNIPLDQQQALHMQKAFVEGMDGYEILSADEAEPMTVTRGNIFAVYSDVCSSSVWREQCALLA